ncbi:hypothetical protein VTN00DRAFT_7555 [Thermoascus crustaceus]|uniref:uncharacterized protein n=1 Tax=Thermoascus crustaceus TaxID=5088 RepID=UPI003744A7DE
MYNPPQRTGPYDMESLSDLMNILRLSEPGPCHLHVVSYDGSTEANMQVDEPGPSGGNQEQSEVDRDEFLAQISDWEEFVPNPFVSDNNNDNNSNDRSKSSGDAPSEPSNLLTKGWKRANFTNL